jgi:pseudouridine-5'-phosphate glycosidase
MSSYRREPATLADIERLIRRLVPDLVRRELEAHAGRLAAAPVPLETAIADDDVAALVERSMVQVRAARRRAGGSR